MLISAIVQPFWTLSLSVTYKILKAGPKNYTPHYLSKVVETVCLTQTFQRCFSYNSQSVGETDLAGKEEAEAHSNGILLSTNNSELAEYDGSRL